MFNKGDQLSTYVIDEKIGEGCFGFVFKAINQKDSSVAAVKVSKLNLPPEEVGRFQKENDILHSLMPNQRIITPLTKILENPPYKFYSMELADYNLDGYLNSQVNLEIKNKIQIFIKVCEGVHHAHSKDIVHRDLWWNNILIKKDLTSNADEPKITDFGRAKDFNSSGLTYTPQEIWGHEYVCPPERYFMIWDKPDTAKYMLGDMYALGIILSFIIRGSPSFYASAMLSSIKLYLALNQIELNKLSTTERHTAYDNWLKSIDFALFAPNLLVTIPDRNMENNINKIIEKLCKPNYSQRHNSISDLISDLKSLV